MLIELLVSLSGSDVWKVEQNANAIADGFPKSIASTFAGLPNDIDAALYYPRNQRTYFFKVSVVI